MLRARGRSSDKPTTRVVISSARPAMLAHLFHAGCRAQLACILLGTVLLTGEFTVFFAPYA